MPFRMLPGATHDQPAIDPGNLTCCCEVCPSKAKERGIDGERARRGFPELEPSMRVLSLRAVSMMLFRVLARWIILERVFAGPSEFGHSGFRRIIRSTDPTLQIVEVVVERRSRFPRGFALRILRLWTLVVVPAVAPILFRSHGEEFILLVSRESRKRMPEALLRFLIHGSNTCQEFLLVSRRIYTEQQIDEPVHLSLG